MASQLSMDDQFLTLINRIIEENLSNEYFSVENLADKAGLSRSMLHRKLIRLTGKSATDLITEVRLTHARELLVNDTATASEIAYRVGFNSPSYFNKVFKKRFKISPGDFKKGIATGGVQRTSRQSQKIQKSTRSGNSRIRLAAMVIIIVFIITGGIVYLSHEEESSEKSIAILPFDNLSTYPENQFFADGIVEDLLNRLSTIKDLKVISRTSSEMFRNKGSKTIPEIAEILGVSYILEGSVQREEEHIRISVQLIDAKKDDHILSRQYDREISEFFIIQSEIATQIISELSVVLTRRQEDDLAKGQTNNPAALSYYQMGMYLMNRRSQAEFLQSIDKFKMAIREDSNYAKAWAGMADAYYNLSWHKWIDDVEGKGTAMKLAQKALEIDPDLPEAHTVLGAIYKELDCDMKKGEKELLKALENNPNYAVAYHYYCELLLETGRPELAREYINKGLLVDPLSFITRFMSAITYRDVGDYRKALEENQRCLDLVRDHPWAIDQEFFIYLQLHEEEAAFESFKKYARVGGEYTLQQADSAYQASGMNGLLRLRAEKYKWWAGKAICYALIGENERAIETLELAFNKYRLRPFDLYQVYPQTLKSDPRFKALEKKLGLKTQ